ncbi:MAG: DEAD/DEAH box helicase family protein [Prevotella sp.]|nr:DEAD/DEAH box helicase family protein [Prevotella sp.]
MKEIKLFDYQEDMKERIEKAFESHQSVMVQMPTGTGKTILLAEVVKSEERRVKNPCVWIVVHRRELVEQIKETLKASLTDSLNVKSEMLNVNKTKQLDSSLFTLPSSLTPRVFSIQWLSRHSRDFVILYCDMPRT